jgi:DNA-binding HxlR family transcriptional regulator
MIVRRLAYAESPPRAEYNLTKWGQALCPALDTSLQWSGGGEATEPADNA